MSFEVVGVKLEAQGAAGFNSAMAAADKSVTAFGHASGNTFKQMPGLSDIAVGALHRVGAIAIDMFAKAGRAAIGFFSDSISVAGDFESGMNKFAAVAGGALQESGLSLKQFRDQFIQIGKDLPVSTAEVQQAAIEMVKGGIDPATIAAGGLKQVIQFAAAADMDLASASTVAAKALGGWVDSAASAQVKADFLTHSTDLLSKAANASTVDVADLALGLYNVQGTAKLAGVSFDETVTALAELAPSFSSSADAGTSFKTFLSRLQPTTKPAIAAMKGLGLFTEETGSKFYDASGKFIGMEKASGILQASLDGLTDAQKQATLQAIFGQDAIRVAAVLAEKGADGYAAMTAALAKQMNVSEMAKQKQAGFNTAMDNFKGSVEALQITIGSVLLPVLTDLFNTYLAPGINTVTSFAESIFSASNPIAALTTAIDGVLPGFGALVGWAEIAVPQFLAFVNTNWDGLVSALTSVGTAFGTFVVLTTVVEWIGGAVAAIGALGAAFTAAGGGIAGIVALLGGPVTLTIAAVALAAGALVLAWQNDWGGIQEKTAAVWAFVEPVFTKVVDWLKDNIPKAVKVAADFWTNTLWPALQKVWAFINTNVIPIFVSVVGTHFKVMGAGISTLSNFWTNTLWPALQKVWSFFDTNIIPVIKALANVWFALLKKEIQILSDLWTKTLSPALETAYKWLSEKLSPATKGISGFFGDLSDKINKDLGPAFKWLSDNVLQPVATWFSTIGQKVQDLVGWLNDLANKINSLPSLPGAYTGHSPPPIAQWMSAIAGQTAQAARAMTMLRSSARALPASPMAIMAGQGGMSSATYNQQRTTNLTYHTQYAPPVNHSMAIANALAG